MAQAKQNNKIPEAPKSSILKNKEAMGLFTTPQNMAISPIAAPNPGSRPRSPPATFPKVAPIKKEGTISPPLYPAAKVIAVNTIFNRNASGLACSPASAFVTTSIPAPL